MRSNPLLYVFLILFLAGCTTLGTINLTEKYGKSSPKERVTETLLEGHLDYWSEVKPIVESRCVVCHACYDAPCQLKLSAIEGIERGASKTPVYQPTRLLEAEPTRLFMDAENTQQWRDKEFFSVLNEYKPSLEANREASLIHRMLTLKQQHPLPKVKVLNDEFEFQINRSHECPKPEEFPKYAKHKPLWGMPYALPGLSEGEHQLLTRWIEQGANYTDRGELQKKYLDKIDEWERLLNGDSKKHRLASRYIYEHLFLGNLYFEELSENKFFKLVRSSTPPGQALKIIATRRPYDDPKVERVYYRFFEVKESIVAKTHMPYALNNKRKALWQKLFFERDFQVSELPGYDEKTSANPFATFQEIPVTSRYEFMLSEAQYTIMGFIKGPVCRGQTALNVINDHFWVFFVEPAPAYDQEINEFYRENYHLLQLPAAEGSSANPLFAWREFAKKQKEYLKKRDALFREIQGEDFKYDLSVIWDGDGENPNAALTVMRHFDSATVERGLLGTPPKTSWVLGYTDLERIHYLLVAGYDVYGNVGHQLLSRLYMDFLRMDGESYFLFLLPDNARHQERSYWYREADDEVLEYLSSPSFESSAEPNIEYVTNDPKQELYKKLKQRLSPLLEVKRDTLLSNDKIDTTLNYLFQHQGRNVKVLAEHSIVHVSTQNGDRYYTLIRNSAHLNITSMFGEKKHRIPKEDTLMILKGFVGSYPGAFFSITEQQVESFVNTVLAVRNERDYSLLKDKYGIRRTDKEFWAFSDRMHRNYGKLEPLNSGLLDYNRLENR